MLKKKYMIIALAIVSVLLGSLLVNNVILAQSGGSEYDPWLDYDEDGTIDVNDLYPLGEAYGSSGDPTRTVYMKQGTYWWTGTDDIPPGWVWFFYNATQGYRQMTFVLMTNSAVDVSLSYCWFLANGFEMRSTFDSFSPFMMYYETYNITKSPSILIVVENPSVSDVAEVTLGIYMTT